MRVRESLTDPRYWDCECEKNYIHQKSVAQCAYCGFSAVKMPDSRVLEIEEALRSGTLPTGPGKAVAPSLEDSESTGQ